VYKPIPSGAIGLRIDLWSCGDDECDCFHTEIRAIFPSSHPDTPKWWGNPPPEWSRQLWEGEWGSHNDGVSYEKYREELQAACDHYNIGVKLEAGTVPYDWEGEKRF
jgi:hypothetical protein